MHPPRRGGKGRREGRALFVSEYAERGEWFVPAFGEGSRDSKENCLACWCGVEGTELECVWPWGDVERTAVLCAQFLDDSAACLAGILAGASFEVITKRFFSKFWLDRLPFPDDAVNFPGVCSFSDALLEVRDLGATWTGGEVTTGGSGGVCRPPPLVGEMSLL